VVCLIADPAWTPLDRATVADLRLALGGTAGWLAGDEACGLPVDGGDSAAIRALVEAAMGDPPYDVGILPAPRRRKRLLVSDMDSTMITVECIDELADPSGRQGGRQRDHAPGDERRGRFRGHPASPGRTARRAAGRGFRAGVSRAHPAHAGRPYAGADHARLGRAAMVSGGFVPFVGRMTPGVAAIAPIVIRRGDLTALLYLQGVAKSDFMSS